MADVEIRFEREGLEGIVPVGTYVGDAMRRLGVRDVEPCDGTSGTHGCVVDITTGGDLLSPMTAAETALLGSETGNENKRLACHAKIERPGELVIMTAEKKEQEKEQAETSNSEDYRKQFTELPLEKKVADLMRLEAITLGETVSFIVNSPFKIFEKVGDVMAEFGLKLEREAKKAQRPAEHVTEDKKEPAAATNGDNEQKSESV